MHRSRLCALSILMGSFITCGSIFAQDVALPGTEAVVSFGTGRSVDDIAREASQQSGLPIVVMRELDERHAVFAVDQQAILDRLRAVLMDSGAQVSVIEGSGPKVMGRDPIPKLHVTFNDSVEIEPRWLDAFGYSADQTGYYSGAVTQEQAFAFASVEDGIDIIEGNIHDWQERQRGYELVASGIEAVTRLGVDAFAGDEAGSFFVAPAANKLVDSLTGYLAASSQGSAELVQSVRPFGSR